MLLKPYEVALRLRIHPDTLRAWRYAGRGPAYVRIEGQVMYMDKDVNEYIEAQRVATSEVAK